MSTCMRNCIRCSAIGLAGVAFLWVNFDASVRPMPGTPRWNYQPSAIERFEESLVVAPFALLVGALWGAILGACISAVGGGVRWACSRFDKAGK